MSEAASAAVFGDALRAAVSRFESEELIIRAEQSARVESGTLPRSLDEDVLLERRTRRFLIDPMLRALGWDPDDPNQVAEESRAWAENGDRIYFDYLGVSGRRMPTLLVEAKGADSASARRPYEDGGSASTMGALIGQALGKLKTGEDPGLLAQWVAWLKDLRAYVVSFGEAGRLTLKRVVITAGRWLVIFKNPVSAFIELGEPDPTEIFCYVSSDEIVARHAEIFSLLARHRLIDTLPLTTKLGEALQILEPTAVTQAFRGVVVATRMTGGMRSEFPHRAVYPALVLVSGGRVFATVDYTSAPAIEPLDASELSRFLADLAARGEAFQKRVLGALNRPDLEMVPLAQFPLAVREPDLGPAFAPEPGSTAALAPAAPVRPQLVRPTGERNAHHEFLVVTGQSWFYKAVSPTGPECDLHSFPNAKKRGVAGEHGRFEYVAESFTISADPQNCEHADLAGMRRARCQVLQIESHLCCWACGFLEVCWETAERARLPCGNP